MAFHTTGWNFTIVQMSMLICLDMDFLTMPPDLENGNFPKALSSKLINI